LTKPINWELIRQHQMVKYVTAIRLGTAETESILRRFVRSNIQHPTYKAFAELGRAVKTIFLCRYLHDEGLRREINEGWNVIEQWNSANDFIFFARHGEMVSNRREDHEISMLARVCCTDVPNFPWRAEGEDNKRFQPGAGASSNCSNNGST
jgi:TnpA family transposase